MQGFLRLLAAAVLAGMLLGCSDIGSIRGRLTYDLRPEPSRHAVYFPELPETPRYRYLGELVGEPNFEDRTDRTLNSLSTALKWFAGVFDPPNPLLLQRPQGIAVGGKGQIYVVDTGRNAVLVFEPSAAAEEKSEKGEGQLQVWELADGRVRFAGPVAVTPVWGDEVAVSDAALGFVVRLDGKGQLVGKVGQGLLKRPTGLAFDRQRGLLFVADTVASDIKVFDRNNRLVNNFGSPGAGPGEFNAPTHMAFHGDKLYVSDTLNSRIQIFDAEGHRLREFGQRGIQVGDLVRPKGIAVSDDGIVYVVESYFGHLLAFNENGEVLMSLKGSGHKDEGRFRLPSGVWTDNRGRVFVADMFNGRVVVFQLLGGDGS